MAVLGPTAAENLFGQTDPIGLQFRIGRVPFEVIGLTAPKGMDANGFDQDDLVLVPLGSAMHRLFNVDHIDTIYVQAQSAELLDQAKRTFGDFFFPPPGPACNLPTASLATPAVGPALLQAAFDDPCSSALTTRAGSRRTPGDSQTSRLPRSINDWSTAALKCRWDDSTSPFSFALRRG